MNINVSVAIQNCISDTIYIPFSSANIWLLSQLNRLSKSFPFRENCEKHKIPRISNCHKFRMSRHNLFYSVKNYLSFKIIFLSYRDESIRRWSESGIPREKPPDTPTSRTWLVSHVTRAQSEARTHSSVR